jgi:hypothetical protein
MKRTFMLITAAMFLAGSFAFAKESTVIDFSLLKADTEPDARGYAQNTRTMMNYDRASGSSFTADQKSLMKTSLALDQWEVELNSSAREPVALAASKTKGATVKQSANVPFAGQDVLGVYVLFPDWANNASAKIVPPYEIQAYEKLEDSDSSETQQYRFDNGYGVVRNVGTLKSVAVTTFGDNYPHKLFVLLADQDGITRRYYMGTLQFDGWKTLIWNNPNYISDVRTREIRVYPIYPRGLPYVKFCGFQVARDANDIGHHFVGYFKDVKVIYDLAVLSTDRDIAEEDLWKIIETEEKDRQDFEMSRFGNKQVQRYIEKDKQATEEKFTSSLYENSTSNAQSTVQ